MPYAGEHHSHAALVRGCNDFLVTQASARLYDGLCARQGDHVDAVAERKEGVGRDDRSLERKSRLLRLEFGDTGGVDPAHLPRADAERASVPAEYDRIRLGVLGDAPREEQVADLFGPDRKSTRLNSSHLGISYAVFCLK